MPARELLPIPRPGQGVRFNTAVEAAVDGLYRALNAVRENKTARAEFEARITTLIDDLEREWAANGGPPAK